MRTNDLERSAAPHVTDAPQTFSVVIPTYRRPDDIERCLAALAAQVRRPDEVVVVIRSSDDDTLARARTFERFGLPLLVVEVAAPGVIAALNAGFARTSGEIIAVTDDDARPRPDWVLRLEAHFRADAAVGGVGGRDRIGGVGDVPDGGRRRVGTVQWWGRRLGNHHLGVGGPRVVDILKGVNMSFRRLAIQGMEFDSRMRGEGAQPHFEVEFSLRLRRRGWKLIYDPDAAVDHFPGALTAGDHRARRHPRAVTDAVHNETVALLEHLSFARRLVFWVWAVAVGTRCAPGLVQWLRFLPSEPVWTTRKLAASLRGRYAAVLTRRAALVARNDS